MSTDTLWPWIGGGALLVLLAGAWALIRLRRHDDEAFAALDEEPLVIEPEPVVDTLPPAPPVIDPPTASTFAAMPVLPVEPAPDRARPRPEPVAAPQGRPRFAFEFRPLRAGVNLLTATAEAEITVTNTGNAPADDVRTEMRLVSAHAGQDDEIAAIYVAPITRSATPAFTLAPGETRQLRLTAALPRDSIRVLTASDRPMFVPLAVVNITARGIAQAGQAFAIGIERPGSGKLAPFWLDGPSRMYNSVAARAHGEPLER